MTGRRTWMRRVATVGVVLTACGLAGAGSASASSGTAAPQGDLLGLNALVGGVTTALTGPQQETGGAAARPAGEANTEDGLAGTVSKLPLLGPILGPIVGPVVAGLPLLGNADKPAAAESPAQPEKPGAPAPAKDNGTVDRGKTPVAKPEMSPVGSTWTAPRNAGTVHESSEGSGGVAGAAAEAIRSVSSLLPETAAGKVGMGAAAVGLIVLGGIAVAGAAGAAGAAGRRGLVGGAW